MLNFSLNGVDYAFDVEKFSLREAREVAELTGLTLPEYTSGLINMNNVEALAAMVYLARKRAGEECSYSDIDFDVIDLAASIFAKNSAEEPE
jgi:hypothetical protein